MVGIGLMAVAGGMAVSALVETFDGGSATVALASSTLLTGLVGAVVWSATGVRGDVSRASAFAAAAWTWVAVSLAGALPFLFSGTISSIHGAIFESVSGFTATGSTVLAPIEGNSDGVLFWRSLTQWYGGMGMIVLAVAILPFLGVGGLELLQAESPGPTSERLAHRVSDTARRLWLVYVGLTAATTVALLLAGTNLYDAVTHAFTAVATGGFSRYDASVGHFSSLAVELVLVVAMLAGATSFTLHWWALTSGRWSSYWRRSELRFWLALMAVAVALMTIARIDQGRAVGRALRESLFTVVSISSTTGFGVVDLSIIAASAQLALLVLMIIGGMTGSTSGALKAFRAQIMFRVVTRAVRRVRHPSAVVTIRADGRAVPPRVVDGIAAFALLYAVVLVLGGLAICATGADLLTAAGVTATTMGGVGPGLGEASADFTTLNDAGLAISDLLMLAGRLEIIPMLLMGVAIRDAVRHRRHRRVRARVGR
jgi:trk system potassium uptake protein TrkH